MKREIETTKDGSHTLFVPELNEHYHSTNGAIQEANHVFIDAALNHCNKKNINILEIGFGTGLNAFLTLNTAENKKIHINYTTLELYPISSKDIQQLNYSNQIDNQFSSYYYDLHQTDWEVKHQISKHFSLLKIQIDFSNPDSFKTNTKYDIVYFDAFGPDKQPEMWQQPIFEKIFSVMSAGGILTTYSAKGVIRRMLQNIGFIVERIPGPIGKREMLRATKP